MRIAYSIVTSEIMQAEHADYGDCAKYQIVCPCCREAVFKGKREPIEKPAIHYFSHYHATSAEARLCEARVALMAKPHIAATAIEGHGQTLAHFMSVFRESVVDSQEKMGIVPANMLRREAYRIIGRSDFDFLLQPVEKLLSFGVGWASKHKLENPTFNARDDLATSLKKMRPYAERSPFWLRRQASYALDVLAQLNTEQAKGNLRFIAGCIYSVMYHAPEAYAMEVIYPESRGIARALYRGDSPTEIIRLARMAGGKQHAAGYNAGKAAVEANPDHLRELGVQIMPKGRKALMSSAGGSVFAAAARPNEEALRAVISHSAQELAEIKKQRQETSVDLAILQLAQDSWGPLMGLLGGIRYADLVAQPALAVASASPTKVPFAMASGTPRAPQAEDALRSHRARI